VICVEVEIKVMLLT